MGVSGDLAADLAEVMVHLRTAVEKSATVAAG
jgi:hypothetical protein